MHARHHRLAGDAASRSSTEFPLRESRSFDDFLSSGVRWRTGGRRVPGQPGPLERFVRPRWARPAGMPRIGLAGSTLDMRAAAESGRWQPPRTACSPTCPGRGALVAALGLAGLPAWNAVGELLAHDPRCSLRDGAACGARTPQRPLINAPMDGMRSAGVPAPQGAMLPACLWQQGRNRARGGGGGCLPMDGSKGQSGRNSRCRHPRTA